MLTVRTNKGYLVEAEPEHHLRFIDDSDIDGLQLYFLVRGRIEVLVTRPVMYELVEHSARIDSDSEVMFNVLANS